MHSSKQTINSYRHVRRISRRSGSSFYRSFWLLPRGKRNAMCALYAFARITDDIGDCNEPAALRTRWLDWWRQTTALNLISETPIDHVPLATGLASDTSRICLLPTTSSRCLPRRRLALFSRIRWNLALKMYSLINQRRSGV